MTDTPHQQFRVGDEEHEIGNPSCPEFWTSYPVPCEQEINGTRCPGLVHASFGDENTDGDYWLFTACDVCGEHA